MINTVPFIITVSNEGSGGHRKTYQVAALLIVIVELCYIVVIECNYISSR